MHALVLSGGGAKGAYQLGCLETLYAKGFKPDVIIGTSVGAINACGLSYLGLEGLKEVWFSINRPSDILKAKLHNLLWGTGYYALTPLKELMKKHIYPATDNPSIPFWVSVCDLRTNEVTYRSNNANKRIMIQDVLCSSSMPTIMEAVDEWLVDGGLRDIIPLSFAIKTLQADEVTVISAHPLDTSLVSEFKPTFPKIISYLTRAVDVMTSEIQAQDVKLCELYNQMEGKRHIKFRLYAPDHYPAIGALDFAASDILMAYHLGKAMGERPIKAF